MVKNTEKLFENFKSISRANRLKRLQELCDLGQADLDVLSGKTPFHQDLAENFIENVIGVFPIPLGVATYFCIDGRDIAIPMAVEETSIVAAASATAKWLRKQKASICTSTLGRHIIGQIQFPSVSNIKKAKENILQHRTRLLEAANEVVPNLVARGGGVQDIEIRSLKRVDGEEMLVLHLHCDPCDAMGANLINQVCENVKPFLEEWTGETVGLCIVSNLVDTKLTRAEVRVPNIDPALGAGIEEASIFAETDPYRATTHNKGVLNGIDSIAIATGNDWRAVEAGVHAYCSRKGQYKPVSTWRMEGTTLVGVLEAPIVVGSVGGVTRLHPTANICMKILGVQKAAELSRIMAAVGLVQNLAALRALSTVGIVNGHMSLHATNLAIAAGAETDEITRVRDRLFSLIQSKKMLTLSLARDVLLKTREVVQNAKD